MASQSTTETRPYPTLLFHAVPDESTPGVPLLTHKRWCTVDTPDGLAEMIQTIVSAPDSDDGKDDNKTTALYLAFHAPADLLAIHLHPTSKIYVVDLPANGGTEALGFRALFNPAQLLHAKKTTTTTTTTGSRNKKMNDSEAATNAEARHREQQRISVLEIGALPSLRGLLESPTLKKVVFDSTATAHALHRVWGVALRGVRDLQIVELAGRPVPLFHHKHSTGRGGGGGGGGAATAKLRTLRACLE